MHVLVTIQVSQIKAIVQVALELGLKFPKDVLPAEATGKQPPFGP